MSQTSKILTIVDGTSTLIVESKLGDSEWSPLVSCSHTDDPSHIDYTAEGFSRKARTLYLQGGESGIYAGPDVKPALWGELIKLYLPQTNQQNPQFTSDRMRNSKNLASICASMSENVAPRRKMDSAIEEDQDDLHMKLESEFVGGAKELSLRVKWRVGKFPDGCPRHINQLSCHGIITHHEGWPTIVPPISVVSPAFADAEPRLSPAEVDDYLSVTETPEVPPDTIDWAEELGIDPDA